MREREEINRRTFLKVLGLGTGTALLSGVGGVVGGEAIKSAIKNLEETAGLKEELKTAHQLQEDKGYLITNPMDRFNRSMYGFNPDLNFPHEEKFNQPLSRKVQRELKRPHAAVDPETSQVFSVLTVNRKKFLQGEIPIVFLPPYINSFEDETTNYRISEVARQTERPVLAIDFPGFGRGDGLIAAQIAGLQNGDWEELIKGMLRVIKLTGIREFDVTGQSLGALGAVLLARYAHELKIGLRPRKFAIVEPPIGDYDVGELIEKFVFEEGKYLTLYQTFPFDPQMIEAAHLDETREKQVLRDLFGPLVFLNRDHNLYYAQALTHNILPQILLEALTANPDLTGFIAHGALSQICPDKAVADLLREVRNNGFAGRLSEQVYLGAHHTVLEQAKEYGSYVRIHL